MKILFTLRFFPSYGGGETVTIRLAESFASEGNEVHVFYLWNRGDMKVDSRIILHKVKGVSNPKKGEKINFFDNKVIYSDLIKYVDKNNFDVVINQWLEPKMVFKAAHNKAKIIHCRHYSIYTNTKRVVIAKKILGDRFVKTYLRHKFLPYLVYSDKYIMLCNQYAEEIKELFSHKYDKKIDFCLNPCRYNLCVNDAEEFKTNSLCYVGRLNKIKNVEVLISAWAEICIKFPSWNFYIIGDGPQREYLQELSSKLECKNIFFTGFVDPLDYYKKCKLMLSSSTNEGYPMTIIEAMNFGCVPVVARTYSAIDEIIEDKVNGILIQKNNSESFISALNELLNNEFKIKKIAELSCNASIKYNIREIIKKWHYIFDNL